MKYIFKTKNNIKAITTSEAWMVHKYYMVIHHPTLYNSGKYPLSRKCLELNARTALKPSDTQFKNYKFS